NIDVFALRFLCTLIDEGNVSRAATKLGTTQPAMSHVLRRLRSYFGDPLFVWAGGRMVPTPRALHIEGEVRPLVKALDRIKSESPSFDPNITPATMKVVATGHVESLFMANVLRAVAKQAPGCRVDIRGPNALQDIAALENGQSDFLVGWH